MDVHRILVGVGVALLALQCLKFVGVLSAIKWIVANGEDFIGELKKREDGLSDVLYWDLLDRAKGKTVLPLGVLEYRLLRFAGRRSPLAGTVLRLGRVLLYDFTSMGLLVMVYLFLAGTPVLRNESRGSVAVIAWASAGLAVLQLIAIYAEACVSYARLGSYGLGWHGSSRYSKNLRAGTYFTEAKTLAGAVLYSLGIGGLIFYFSAGHGARFEALTVTQRSPSGVVADLLNCLYYSVVTFFTADTPDPSNGPARLATAISVVQAVCALVVALTTATLYISPQLRSDRALTDGPSRSAATDIGQAAAPVESPGRAPVSRLPGFLGGVLLGAVLVAAARAGRTRKRQTRS